MSVSSIRKNTSPRKRLLKGLIRPHGAAERRKSDRRHVDHRGDGKRFIVRADEKLTAFVDLESAIRKFFPNFAPEFLEKKKKKKQMRAFNSSYVRYVAASSSPSKKNVLLLYGERRFRFCLAQDFC